MNICNSKPVISIIVPVYKTEKYLRRCIDSILAQTFTDFECIVIDDGSPDGCPTICDEYTEKDKRIIAIHQKNKGVSAARNAGLDIAKGDWIGFVDSDDWVEPIMLEELDSIITKNNSIQIISYDFFFETKKQYLPTLHNISLQDYTKEIIKGNWGVVWRHLIKRELIVTYQFDINISHGEDYILISQIFLVAKNIILFDKKLYHYNHENQSSVIHTQNLAGLTEQFTATLKVEEFIRKLNLYTLYEADINLKKIRDLYSCLVYILKIFRNNKAEKYVIRSTSLMFKIKCFVFIFLSKLIK
jgi:glycosyltransferase involved in cell wall biosynthesis